MRTRVLTALALSAIGLPAIMVGGVFYFILMATFVVGAAWEYVRLFRAMKIEPHEILAVGGVFLIVFARVYFPQWEFPLFIMIILLAMVLHMIAYERGRDQASLDFAATIVALAYLGLIGAFLVDLRNLPNGAWWVMTVLPCVWFTDTGAYMIGSVYGKHKMSPRLSPKKSWEGYFAGIVSSIFGGLFFLYVYSHWGPLTGVALWKGAALGLLIGALAPLGDFGESMLKRQSGMKDSSNVFPGHGGFFDRIDSWLWGSVIGFYFITWFIL